MGMSIMRYATVITFQDIFYLLNTGREALELEF